MDKEIKTILEAILKTTRDGKKNNGDMETLFKALAVRTGKSIKSVEELDFKIKTLLKAYSNSNKGINSLIKDIDTLSETQNDILKAVKSQTGTTLPEIEFPTEIKVSNLKEHPKKVSIDNLPKVQDVKITNLPEVIDNEDIVDELKEIKDKLVPVDLTDVVKAVKENKVVPNKPFELSKDLITKDNRIKVEVDRAGGGGADFVSLFSDDQKVGSTNPLPVSMDSDIQIGAVEIKDGDTDQRMTVNDSGQAHVVMRGTLDTGNSTTTNLLADAVFTGTSIDTLDYSAVTLVVHSDVASATDGLAIQYSSDDSDWHSGEVYTITAGATKFFTPTMQSKYMRVVYTNGSTGTGTFHIHTALRKSPIKWSSHNIDDHIKDQDDAELVKAVITGKRADGVYDNVSLTNGGNMKVSIEEANEADPTFGYGINNTDNDGNDVNPNYYGFEDKDGNWYIMKEDKSSNPAIYTYSLGASDYSTAWTNRASQSYDTFGNTF